MFNDSDVIFSYTRKQAIEDGVLIDVTETARQCGFKYPVAVTARLWAEVVVPNEKAKAKEQSESGRLWDVLWMLYMAILMSPLNPEILFYTVLVNDGFQEKEVQLKSVCGPGDEGEPVVTIMMPFED
jgi:hypothetical protein